MFHRNFTLFGFVFLFLTAASLCVFGCGADQEFTVRADPARAVFARPANDDGDGDDDKKDDPTPQVSVEQFNQLSGEVSQLADGIGTINETLKGLQGKDDDDKGDDKKGDDKKDDDPMKALQAEVADLKDKYSASEKERKDLLAKQADDSRRASIREIAKENGVDSESLDIFVDAKQGQFQLRDGELTIVDAAGNPVMSAKRVGQQINAEEYFEALFKKEKLWQRKQVVPDTTDPLQKLRGGNQDAGATGDVQIVTVDEMRKLRGTEEGRKAILAGKVKVADQPLQMQSA